jgi:hypothetical protein
MEAAGKNHLAAPDGEQRRRAAEESRALRSSNSASRRMGNQWPSLARRRFRREVRIETLLPQRGGGRAALFLAGLVHRLVVARLGLFCRCRLALAFAHHMQKLGRDGRGDLHRLLFLVVDAEIGDLALRFRRKPSIAASPKDCVPVGSTKTFGVPSASGRLAMQLFSTSARNSSQASGEEAWRAGRRGEAEGRKAGEDAWAGSVSGVSDKMSGIASGSIRH